MSDEYDDDDDIYDDASMPKSRPVEDAEMDITPMIDCVFLLLIFFLVTSKFSQPVKVPLPPARHGFSVADKSAVIITLANEGADRVGIYMGEGKDDSKRLGGADADQEDDILAEYVAREIVGKECVLIKAEKDIKHRAVARVSKAISRVEDLQTLYVAVMEVQ